MRFPAALMKNRKNVIKIWTRIIKYSSTSMKFRKPEFNPCSLCKTVLLSISTSLWLLAVIGAGNPLFSQPPAKSLDRDPSEISRAFELRYVTADPRADGETDFKGETAIFDTEQRVEYLGKWAQYGRHFFNDPELRKIMVQDEDVASVLDQLKPQPLPQVRRQIRLEDWKFVGYREGQRQEELENRNAWRNSDGVTIEDGELVLTGHPFVATFAEQPWRMNLNWKAMVPDTHERVAFRLSDYVVVGFTEKGRFFYEVDGVEIPAGSYIPGEFYKFEVELDPDGGLIPDFDRTDVQASSEIAIDLETHERHKRHFPAVYATHGFNTWTASESTWPQWISFELEEERNLVGADLAFYREDHRTYSYQLEISDDHERWVPVTEEKSSSAEDRWTPVTFDQPGAARYVRVVFTGASSPEFPAALSMARFYDENGRVFLKDDKPTTAKFNLSVNGKRLADYVPYSRQPDKRQPYSVGSLHIETEGTVILDQIVGTGFDQVTGRDVREYPFEINTFIDTDFEVRPDPEGFQHAGYDDSEWEVVPYRRYAHGGERRKEEALYLRRKVRINDFERAVLNVETVRPSADIYINGGHVRRVGRHPEKIDITNLLNPHEENLVAVRVDPYRVEEVQYHMSSDPWTGWFAGLMEIELTEKTYIDDVFAYAEAVGNPARMRLEVQASSKNEEAFRGHMVTRVYPWYPEESGSAAGESSQPIHLAAGETMKLSDQISIPDPELWSTATPNLYKVHVILQDETGSEVDDFVLTTGLRTISQEGGTFRINSRPEMLNGPLLFGHHAPLERIAQWMFSPPKERWIHDILLLKSMNGNTFRMSIHDRRVAGVNDRRLAHIGDQMGIMFMWQTPAWVRTGTTDGFDFEGIPLYARQVRNNPSIVLWQPGNHPHPEYSMEWFEKVHDTFAEVDPSRLISPAADMSRMRGSFDNTIGDFWFPTEDDQTYHSWTSPLLARGTMDYILGYGTTWDDLRIFRVGNRHRGMKRDARAEYLNSKTHAWIDFESEETIGQANWNVTRGKPWHRMYSYEINYDLGSIGRKLDFDEWQESQAWQALSLYEAYRKKRRLDFDGMNWCPMRGGGNTATYMKPLLDYENHPKLGYYAHRMVFQPVLAGSKNVDIVYGPNDDIPVMVVNLGKAQTVDVIVRAKTMDGTNVAEMVYEAVELPDGKGMVKLGNWKPELQNEKYYAFEYIVKAVSETD